MHSTNSNRRIIFRADGNSRIGLGHVVRSLALATMLRDEFECVFAIQEPDEVLKEQILQTCHGIITLPVCAPTEDRFTYELAAYISEQEIVVLDGYNFDTAYQQTIKSRDAVLVCIDDIHAYPFVADVVLNQAGSVGAENYKTASYTKLLLGPEYALLREPILKASKAKREVPKGKLNILLNLGGADPDNHTLQLAKELAQSQPAATIQVVVGSAYKHLPELQDWLNQHKNYKLHQNLDAAQMATLMKKCAVAITSASGVAYEYAAVGGVLFVKQTADNQDGLYNFLTRTGVAQIYSSETIAALDVAQFNEQVTIQRQYFDGKSDERLQKVFGQLSLMTNLALRHATIEDLQLVFEWNNDPEVRRRSFNPEPILLENHTRWFKAKLEDANSRFYIAEVNETPAAQIRFDVNADTATISYLISKNFRGNGLGHVILQKGVSKLTRENQTIKTIVGLVQKDNVASVRAFEKAGFTYGTPDPHHPDAHRFVMELPPKA